MFFVHNILKISNCIYTRVLLEVERPLPWDNCIAITVLNSLNADQVGEPIYLQPGRLDLRVAPLSEVTWWCLFLIRTGVIYPGKEVIADQRKLLLLPLGTGS
jgi:hypothetical protein